ncbi:hypothetical protein PBY51_004204 [Eleginops maclovinus]|uniref:Uncharacterized protein n=1 Tax=Eleginops maclovinus TaxID=56733 RepID=A0AAN8AWX9_ELEMC|nr:hypothetical protein PBY51_004204 [Eleginops maclovinus]
MISHLCAATPALYILWIIMAQIAAGQEDREKTTALKDLLSRIDLDELMKKDEPPFTFPKTLEEFEYAFNELSLLAVWLAEWGTCCVLYGPSVTYSALPSA